MDLSELPSSSSSPTTQHSQQKGLSPRSRLIFASLLGVSSGLFWTIAIRKDQAKLATASSYGLAARALGISMLISISSVGLATGLIAWSLNLNSFRDFGLVTRRFLEGLDPLSEQRTEQFLKEASERQ